MVTILQSERLYPSISITNDLFSLTIHFSKHQTIISMQLLTPFVRTKDIPSTYGFLAENLPSVLLSKCFNDKNLPFDQEVRNTEIGHLFEHILLEYLCFNKLASGCSEAIYSGNTKWDWRKNAWGSFTIHISSGYKEISLFQDALEQTLLLINQLLKNDIFLSSKYISSIDQPSYSSLPLNKQTV